MSLTKVNYNSPTKEQIETMENNYISLTNCNYYRHGELMVKSFKCDCCYHSWIFYYDIDKHLKTKSHNKNVIIYRTLKNNLLQRENEEKSYNNMLEECILLKS